VNLTPFRGGVSDIKQVWQGALGKLRFIAPNCRQRRLKPHLEDLFYGRVVFVPECGEQSLAQSTQVTGCCQRGLVVGQLCPGSSESHYRETNHREIALLDTETCQVTRIRHLHKSFNRW
jgi:hypothetical protein